MNARSLILVLFAVLVSYPAWGHETDQYTMPPADREFAELGPQLSQWVHGVIEKGVEKTNGRIKACIERKGSKEELERLQSADEIVRAVNGEFPWAMDVIEGLEKMIDSPQMRVRYPGRVIGYREGLANIYQGAHFPLDPRQLFRIWLGSTMKVYGVYLGTDKIGHFTDMGMNYWREYHKALRRGMSEAEAEKHAVHMGTHGLIFSERGMLGFMTAGAYSNGDLAANYVGLLFYKNLTQPVRLKGQMRPAMLVREGPYWKLAEHVTRDSDFLAWFISDHYNEALNPSLREKGMQGTIRRAVQKRTELILPRYCDEMGRPRPKEWYEQKAAELRTYWGVDYGHMGKPEELITIANTCFEEGHEVHVQTPLYLAAMEHGDVHATDGQGRTALHRAAEMGNVKMVEDLLRRGTDVKLRDRFGAMALHEAAGLKNAAVAKMLMEKGAEVGAKDDFGATALHDAARSGSAEVVALMLAAGADVNAADAYGSTPLHVACRHNREGIGKLLVEKGARIDAKNVGGSTPLHEAAFAGNQTLVQLLVGRGAGQDVRDGEGRTARDVAKASGRGRVVELLK